MKKHSDKLVDNLSSYFPLKRSNSTAWGNVGSLYLMLPGLRGFWPTSVIGGSGELMDISGNGLHLTNNNNTPFSVRGPRSFVTLTTTPRYFNRPDEAAFDIGQDEAYLTTTSRGLTIGCWYRKSSATATQVMIMGKWNSGGNQRSYAIKLDADERIVFQISGDGTNVYEIKAPKITVTTSGRWVFIAGSWWDQNGSISAYISDGTMLTETTNSVGIPGTIFDSTADFTIGAEHGGVNPASTCSVTLAFLCCQHLDYGTLGALFSLSRAFLLRYPQDDF